MKEYMRMIQKAACLIGAAALFLASCEKSEEIIDSYPPLNDEQCMLLPSLIGVEPFGGGSVFTRAASAIQKERQQFNVGEELGNIVTLGNGETENIPQTRADLAAGVFYRMVVYKLDDWNNNSLKVHEQRLCKAGSTTYFADHGDVTTPIYLNYGSYKIFCYSFNKTTADKMTKLADGDANVALADGDDFMSVVIDKTIAAGQMGTNVSLGALTLYHRCCKLTGNLTAEGFGTNTITGTPSLSISGTFTQTGNWSINGSTFAVGTTANITRTFSLSGSGASRSGSVIMLPFTNKALKATYSFKPSGATTTISATNASLSTGTTFTSGGNYTFTVKGLGAYVITEGVESLKIGTYTWATRNVRWNNTFETNLKIWESGNLRGGSQATTSSATTGNDFNSYFNWGRKTPSTNDTDYDKGSTWPSSQNPCPSGYRVPTTPEINDLIMKKVPQTAKVAINGEIFTINNAVGFYSGNKAKGAVLKDGLNVLFLPAAGHRKAAGWELIGSFGLYWCSNGLAGDGARAHGLTVGPGSLGIYDGYLRQLGFSVRCIKNRV